MDHHDCSLTQTDWSMIHEASVGASDAGSAAALERLARRYWPPVYAYIRRSGRDVHEAADLTQGFVCDVVLARRLLKTADPSRGRFRTLLLTALENYLCDQHRRTARGNAKRRERRAELKRQGPSAVGSQSSAEAESQTRKVVSQPFIFSFDPQQLAEMTESAVAGPTPQAAFTAQWSAMLVRRVLDQVRESCTSEGMESHWIVFEQRIVRPMLLNDPPALYRDLVARLGLEDESQAANMMITIKRRFARAVYDEVLSTVSNPDEVPAELNELMRELGNARSEWWEGEGVRR